MPPLASAPGCSFASGSNSGSGLGRKRGRDDGDSPEERRILKRSQVASSKRLAVAPSNNNITDANNNGQDRGSKQTDGTGTKGVPPHEGSPSDVADVRVVHPPRLELSHSRPVSVLETKTTTIDEPTATGVSSPVRQEETRGIVRLARRRARAGAESPVNRRLFRLPTLADLEKTAARKPPLHFAHVSPGGCMCVSGEETEPEEDDDDAELVTIKDPVTLKEDAARPVLLASFACSDGCSCGDDDECYDQCAVFAPLSLPEFCPRLVGADGDDLEPDLATFIS